MRVFLEASLTSLTFVISHERHEGLLFPKNILHAEYRSSDLRLT
jgi:hypothetical protein